MTSTLIWKRRDTETREALIDGQVFGLVKKVECIKPNGRKGTEYIVARRDKKQPEGYRTIGTNMGKLADARGLLIRVHEIEARWEQEERKRNRPLTEAEQASLAVDTILGSL